MNNYRCEAGSLIGFIQQLAANYLPHGYWFYVTGYVPEGKDPAAVDLKLIAKYGITPSRSSRARRKQAGRANVHYLRFERFFVLLATKGEHEALFREEGQNLRDIRREPLVFGGYSLSVKRGQFLKKALPDEPATPDGKYRVRVQIARARYQELRAHICEIAARRSAEDLGRDLYCLPFEPYAPVRKQLLSMLSQANQNRAERGLSKLSTTVLRYRREIVRPFEGDQSNARGSASTHHAAPARSPSRERPA